MIRERQSAGVTAKLAGTSKQAEFEVKCGRRLEKIFWPTVVDAVGWAPCHLASGCETGRKVCYNEIAVVVYLSQGSWEEGCRAFTAVAHDGFGGVGEVTADAEKRDWYVAFVAIGAVAQGMLTCVEDSCHIEAVGLAIMCCTDLVEV